MREFLEILLTRAGHEVSTEGDGAQALSRVATEPFDLVITDLRLGRVSGQEVLETVKRAQPETEVILITAFATTDNAIEAMKAGAYDYVTKPFKVDELLVVVQRALERRAIVRENARLKEELGDASARGIFAGLVGRSPAMQVLYRLVEKVAPTRSTALVTGESGTGKELVARAIHALSSRSGGPFVAVNCGAIPEGLMESELFGHAKGAFTGAHADKVGLFEAGHQGTVFLDEIGELPSLLQVKLLRVLQERKIKRVGGVKDQEVDVRVIAATNRDLAAEVAAGNFREDLYYRLNVIQLKVPPLRDRREDVIRLAEHFLARFSRDVGRPLQLSPEAVDALSAYSFPGNVRELENLIERAATLSDGPRIGAEFLPERSAGRRARAPAQDAPSLGEGFDLQRHLEEIERGLLLRALDECEGVKKRAAEHLGLSFRSFRYRLSKLGLGD